MFRWLLSENSHLRSLVDDINVSDQLSSQRPEGHEWEVRLYVGAAGVRIVFPEGHVTSLEPTSWKVDQNSITSLV